jgi:WD40 repeat protein
MQRLEIKGGSVKSILQIASDGSMLTATSVRENMSARKVWTGHSDGRVCVWSSGGDRGGKTSAGATVMLEREFTVEGGVGVLSMVQIGSNVWLGTGGGSVYVCDADGDGRRGGMKVVSSRGEARTHLGGVRSLLVVGTEVWSASDGGDVNVWKEREREHVRAVHSSAGRVRVMARSPDGGVLTGHQSGIIQVICHACTCIFFRTAKCARAHSWNALFFENVRWIPHFSPDCTCDVAQCRISLTTPCVAFQLWSADGLLRASASTMSSVASLVQGGGFVWTGHTDGRLRIWSAGSEGIAMVRSVHGHNKAVLGIVKDAASVWTVSSNGTVREWSINLLLLERSIDSGVVTINSAPQAESVSHASLAGSITTAPSAPAAKIGGRSRIMIAIGR